MNIPRFDKENIHQTHLPGARLSSKDNRKALASGNLSYKSSKQEGENQPVDGQKYRKS